jgi:carbonic anhydrase/acetyltransferase-like protein (isoleucine patch superfamily)
MLIEHAGKRPRIHESAYVAATAQVVLGRDCIVMENAVVRGRSGRPCRVGDSVLVGPHAHLDDRVIEE